MCVEGDPDGATDVRAAAALLCRQTEALSSVPAPITSPPLCPRSPSSSEGFSFALLRSLQHKWFLHHAAKEDGAGRCGSRSTRSPSSRVLEAGTLLAPAAVHFILLQLVVLRAALEVLLPILFCSPNFFFGSTRQNKLPLHCRCINSGSATFSFFYTDDR